MAGLEENSIKAVLDKVSGLIPGLDMTVSPPEMAMSIHRIIREETGNPDPYLMIKTESNRKALAAYPQFKAAVSRAENYLQEAVRIAIAGNIIDYGAIADLDLNRELAAITRQDRTGKINNRLLHFPDFSERIRKAHTILYLGDNTGEIVFDRILIESILSHYPDKHFVFAVRGAPAINDCLVSDAKECGISEIARVVSNGSEAPGTLLKLCSGEFLTAWQECDLVISKGQGNFESLYQTGLTGKKIYYLFVVKCRIVAARLGCAIREPVLLKGN